VPFIWNRYLFKSIRSAKTLISKTIKASAKRMLKMDPGSEEIMFENETAGPQK
jgi:hypothetical protein